MKLMTRSIMLRLLDRAVIGALILLVMLLAGMRVARAGEIVPSIGITKTIDNNESDAKIFGGLAFRGSLAPMLKSEIGLAYRAESYANDNLTVRMWPLTASLWLSPLPTLYAGGGVGWYHTTLDYAEGVLFQDETQQKFGVHLAAASASRSGPWRRWT